MFTVGDLRKAIANFPDNQEIVTDCCVSGGSNRHPINEVRHTNCGEHSIAILTFDSWDDVHSTWTKGHGYSDPDDEDDWDE